MKKYSIGLVWRSMPVAFLAFLALFLGGCGSTTQPPKQFTPTVKIIPTDPIRKPILTPTVKIQTSIVQPTKTKQSEITNNPSDVLVTKWSVFTHPLGVSIDYPTGWKVEVQNYDGQSTILFNRKRYLEIYKRPIEERRFSNPHTWQPNEGGYEIQWEKPIVVDGADGYEFVWGFDDGAVLLFGIIYSQEYELDVRVQSALYTPVTEDSDWETVDRTIEQENTIFRHMLYSIKFHPATEIPTSTPYPSRTPTATVPPAPTVTSITGSYPPPSLETPSYP